MGVGEVGAILSAVVHWQRSIPTDHNLKVVSYISESGGKVGSAFTAWTIDCIAVNSKDLAIQYLSAIIN